MRMNNKIKNAPHPPPSPKERELRWHGLQNRASEKPPLTPPKEGNSSPPSGELEGAIPLERRVRLGGGRGFCGLKAQNTLAWGNALRNRRLRAGSPMTTIKTNQSSK